MKPTLIADVSHGDLMSSCIPHEASKAACLKSNNIYVYLILNICWYSHTLGALCFFTHQFFLKFKFLYSNQNN